jgi:hypothetical protein
LQIVNAVNAPSLCESPFGRFVGDVKQVLGSFDSFVFQHVGRKANSPAHAVAKEACNHVTESVWWHYIPSFIEGIVRKEEFLSSNCFAFLLSLNNMRKLLQKKKKSRM